MTPVPAHLLMTVDAVGGIWTYGLDLGRALAARGTRVTLAVLGPGLDEAKRASASAAGLDAVELGHSPEWLARDAAEVAAAGAALAAMARARGADLIQLNHPALAADATLPVPVAAVCHSCVATWWAAVRGTALPPDFAWRTALVGRGLRAATAVVAPSKAFAAETARAYGLAQAPVVVLNGRQAPDGAPVTTPPEDVGVTLGRLWDEGKDVATLDRAATLATVPLRAVGPLRGPHGGAIALAACEAVGALDDGAVRALLARRPVFLSAAPYEPFGLAVLEAAQAGCALVLADTPTFRELWDGAATFVTPRDAPGFAQALDGLIADPSRRATLGDAARRRAGRYTVAAQADGMMALYATVLAGAGAAGHEGGDSAEAPCR